MYLRGLRHRARAAPFHPHVTLGRVKSSVSSDDLLSRIESVTFESPTVMIREILLIQSI